VLGEKSPQQIVAIPALRADRDSVSELLFGVGCAAERIVSIAAVSYTHLDVYKRQLQRKRVACIC